MGLMVNPVWLAVTLIAICDQKPEPSGPDQAGILLSFDWFGIAQMAAENSLNLFNCLI